MFPPYLANTSKWPTSTQTLDSFMNARLYIRTESQNVNSNALTLSRKLARIIES